MLKDSEITMDNIEMALHCRIVPLLMTLSDF